MTARSGWLTLAPFAAIAIAGACRTERVAAPITGDKSSVLFSTENSESI